MGLFVSFAAPMNSTAKVGLGSIGNSCTELKLDLFLAVILIILKLLDSR